MVVMTAHGGVIHVARNPRTYTAKSGEQRVYESVLVRRTYRDGAKVRHETLANLSALPAAAGAAIEGTLKGERPGLARSPRCTLWPRRSACPPCSARRAASGTWPWP